MKTFIRKFAKPLISKGQVPEMSQILGVVDRVVPTYGIMEGRGLTITIDEYTVSLQWSGGNYCANRWNYRPHEEAPICKNFELCIWKTGTGNAVKLGENDEVLGHITWDKFETILNLVKQKRFDDIREAAYTYEMSTTEKLQAYARRLQLIVFGAPMVIAAVVVPVLAGLAAAELVRTNGYHTIFVVSTFGLASAAVAHIMPRLAYAWAFVFLPRDVAQSVERYVK